MTGLIWLSVPSAPLLAAMLVVWLRRTSEKDIAPWLWLACLPALVAAAFPGPGLAVLTLWPGARWGLEDSLSQALLGLTAVLWGLASCYAAATQKTDPKRTRFWLFWLLALTGNLLLIISRDSISFYVGFTLMSLSAYGLVAHLPGPGPRQAGRIYLQLAVLGEMLLYGGLMMRLNETGGVLTFSGWQDTPIAPLTAGLLLVGLGLKAGFWPLHLWLPQAHPAAPPAASAVLSGAMLKAGILGLWRFFPEVEPIPAQWINALVAVGLISAFYGALVGLFQQKAKVVLAYSSISQIGYLLGVVALAWHQPEQRALWATLLGLYAVHHGLAKGSLFLGAGLAAKHWLKPWHWWLLFIPALTLAGLPLTSGGAVKTQLKTMLEGTDYYAGVWLLSMGSLATTLVVARALWLMKPQAPSPTPAPRAATAACLILALAPLVLPWLWPDLRAALLYSLALQNTWALTWPVLAAALLSLGAIKLGLRWPSALLGLGSPVRRWSLKLKAVLEASSSASNRSLQDYINQHKHQWRQRERRWNRFWQQGAVTVSAWLVCALLLLGWFW